MPDPPCSYPPKSCRALPPRAFRRARSSPPPIVRFTSWPASSASGPPRIFSHLPHVCPHRLPRSRASRCSTASERVRIPFRAFHHFKRLPHGGKILGIGALRRQCRDFRFHHFPDFRQDRKSTRLN